MKASHSHTRRRGGYVSYVMVLSMGIILLILLVSSYKSAVRAQAAQKLSAVRIDYAEKEEAVLRAIVANVPNRAIRAMQNGSDANSTIRDQLRWKTLFDDALSQANAEESVSTTVLSQFGRADAVRANAGDAQVASILAIFDPIEPDPHSWDVSPGTGRVIDSGLGYPPPLDTAVTQDAEHDRIHPIISRSKKYGSRAESRVGLPVDDYPDFNLIPYPEINFGYAQPGQPFVAKQNWWAFSLDLSEEQDHRTGVLNLERDFIVSIYEIPSQLAISAEAFTVLGQYADGTAWQNATIAGGVFATRAQVEQDISLERVTGRRDLTVSATAKIGNNQFSSNPFDAGNREQYEHDHGTFMPVYLASEAGRAAFVPINRGVDFFDRHVHTPESQTLSSTTWDDYSVGAKQCAMWLDISDVAGPSDNTPTELTLHYIGGSGSRETMVIPLDEGPDTGLPAGYIFCALEDETVNFPTPVDVAYGENGNYYIQEGVSGDVDFTNARFGDPEVGALKSGYYRPSYPFEIMMLQGDKLCVGVYPERMPAFLDLIGAAGPDVNHSLTVNVDHPGDSDIDPPSIPCTDLDYGVVLRECADLTAFSEGFSLVTNLRLYIADDFNVVEATPPAGSGIPAPYYPPSSLFAPEKRYGGEIDPYKLNLSGQLGSLAGDTGAGGQAVHLLDLKGASEGEFAHNQIVVNLAPIDHPEALPPVMMMNWLVVVEERRAEFYVTQN